MSRERELLERAYQYIPMSSVTSQEIRAYLAEPEAKREPIGQGDYVLGEGSEYFDPAPRPEPEPEQEQERLDLIGELHPNGLVDFVNDEMPIHHVFPVKLYAKSYTRPEFVRLREEEIADVLNVDPIWLEMKELVWSSASLLEYARAIEDALEEKNRG